MSVEDTLPVDRRAVFLNYLPNEELTDEEREERDATPYPDFLKYEYYQRVYGMSPNEVDAAPEYLVGLNVIASIQAEAEERIRNGFRERQLHGIGVGE